MDHPEGAGFERGDRVDFDRRVRLQFRGPLCQGSCPLIYFSSIFQVGGIGR